MTLYPTLSFATITESNEPVLHLQETLGWKADRNTRKQTLPPAWLPLLKRGIPLHSADSPDVKETENKKPLSLEPLFSSLNASWIVPLQYQDRLLGLLGLNIKTRGTLTIREDRLFLQALGAQWSSLLANASLSREMAGKREAEFLSSLRAFTFHDLKNAGVALKLLVHNARKNIDSPEFQQELLFCLENISEQIDSSMSQLLSPFQQEYSKTLNFDPVILIQNTVRALNWDNLPDLAIKLSLSDTPPVTGNPRVLETTLRNLLINAREALADSGEILIETRTQSDRLILVVSDNGPGMSREFIETRLFRPFQTTKKKGTGLGLFSCKLLIEQSGGTIDVHSREGEGTEFRITLPYASSELLTSSPSPIPRKIF
jgi:signal transduction histidine kinase